MHSFLFLMGFISIDVIWLVGLKLLSGVPRDIPYFATSSIKRQAHELKTENGGAGNRTPDHLYAKEVLYH